uniref:F-box domain-containing protein n=1 Tax=Compsopogon caeruleus TaxID=31354 RepID=A0A6T6AKC9_9RHOD|mmetsp:Transcript_113/g.186  ORF Transcript_113/g.186 Transcript_113/m.186 type:complete len:327 (+) Transcript_113:278-1258(+)|eukprot:CAMPEP_0184689366 /NCGR_PEP_ID=MMETSP0312-20130426/30593_1 /TAXON_ID=31354 /ORGANISM="Compsopogon coeruleus, Strain SAG 36.94" /LENGTH=326 /DNA_ID=CAMNT_0027146705 /DNA_START=240 /DNA_END=1220 /DNA_ORIENTATION=-
MNRGDGEGESLVGGFDGRNDWGSVERCWGDGEGDLESEGNYDWDDEGEDDAFPLLDLPSELLRCVFTFLPLSDLMRVARVNRELREAVRASATWSSLLFVDFALDETYRWEEFPIRLDTHVRELEDQRAPTLCPAERLYCELINTEFWADFTSREIDRCGFLRLQLLRGTRFFPELSHWSLCYPPPFETPNLEDSFNVRLEFILEYGIPPLGMEFFIWWSSEDHAYISILINNEGSSSEHVAPSERVRVVPPKIPLNPRRPLTEKADSFFLPSAVLRKGTNQIRMKYHADSRKRCFIRRIEMLPNMRDTVRKSTSKRRTVVIVKSR